MDDAAEGKTEEVDEGADAIKAKVAEMESLLAKYTANFPVHQPSSSSPQPTSEVILITGTTGK